MEEYNKLAFLDVEVIRNTDDAINITVYRKAAKADICINWHSHSSLQWKKTTANVLILKAMRICSYKTLQNEEVDVTKHSILYKADQGPNLDLQKERTPDL